MRVTGGMLTNNLMYTLNNNLINMQKLETQMSTGKKISSASDNPIIASRSMKFRTNLAELEQYKRNISDANSWMNVTEQAVMNIESVLEKARELSVQGANGTLTNEDRDKLVEEFTQLKEQLIQEGNTTYAGRYIFSGYKTDEKLIFDESTNSTYEIQHNFDKSEMKQIGTTANYKIKLPYKDSGNPTVNIGGTNYPITTKTTADADAYTPASGDVNFIAETGELVFHQDEVPASAATNIKIDYSKTGFVKGDLNPRTYFKTLDTKSVMGSIGAVAADNTLTMSNRNIEAGSLTNLQVGGVAPSAVVYANSSDTVALGVDEVRVDMDTGKLTFGTNFNPADNVTLNTYAVNSVPDDEIIEYEISTRNKIDVNTLGKDIINKDLVMDFNAIIEQMKSGTATEADMESSFNDMIALIDTHKSDILSEHSKIGAKVNRLEMTENRLDEEKINFTRLLSENEDADIAEVMTNLKSQEMVYNASLSIAAKVVKQSLVDYLR